jgi:hypothetical protein
MEGFALIALAIAAVVIGFFAHPPVEKERPRLARVAAHPCLRFANPHQSRKGCGADGRARHAAARLTSTGKSGLLPECQGALRFWLGRIADDDMRRSATRSRRTGCTVLSAPVQDSLSHDFLSTSDGQQPTSRPPPCARRKSYRPVERRPLSQNKLPL